MIALKFVAACVLFYIAISVALSYVICPLIEWFYEQTPNDQEEIELQLGTAIAALCMLILLFG